MERKWSSLSAICIHLILLCALSVKLESSQTAVSISYLTKFSDQLTSRCKQLVRIRFMVFTRFLACASILPSCLLTWRCEVCRQWCAVCDVQSGWRMEVGDPRMIPKWTIGWRKSVLTFQAWHKLAKYSLISTFILHEWNLHLLMLLIRKV